MWIFIHSYGWKMWREETILQTLEYGDEQCWRLFKEMWLESGLDGTVSGWGLDGSCCRQGNWPFGYISWVTSWPAEPLLLHNEHFTPWTELCRYRVLENGVRTWCLWCCVSVVASCSASREALSRERRTTVVSRAWSGQFHFLSRNFRYN